MRILRAFFNRSGFVPPWSMGKAVTNQSEEKFLPKFDSILFAPALGDGLTPLAEGIQSAFEAEAFGADPAMPGCFPHQPSYQVMSSQEDEELFLDHLRALAAQIFHAQSRLDVVQAHLHAPAPAVGGQNLVFWIEIGVEQGGHHDQVLRSKPGAHQRKTQEPDAEQFRQCFPMAGFDQW